jgi:hypothetical protein
MEFVTGTRQQNQLEEDISKDKKDVRNARFSFGGMEFFAFAVETSLEPR